MFDFKKVLEKIKILDNAKVERGVEYTNVDLNDIDKTEVGVFYSTCTNIPFQDSGGYLTTIVMSSNFTVQKAINASNGDNYQRIKVSGQWKPWIKKES